MSGCGLLVRMHAKPGKDAAVEDYLHSALPTIQQESDTTAWFAVSFGRGEYGTFGVFPDDTARNGHLNGAVIATLLQREADIFERAPAVRRFDVIAQKLPVVVVDPDTKGLLLTFKAKAGHEREVEDFLHFAEEEVNGERSTTAWFAMRTEDGGYGIFDVFPGNEDRFLHLVGHVPRELARNAFTLLGSLPDLEMLNVQAEKIGADAHHVVSR